MPSPFPGMDPYLEDQRLWPSFQDTLVECLCETLQPLKGYELRVGERRYSTGGEQREHYVEVRRGGELVTLLDIVSPANKLTAEGRAAYLATRQDALSKGANAVEVDL